MRIKPAAIPTATGNPVLKQVTGIDERAVRLPKNDWQRLGCLGASAIADALDAAGIRDHCMSPSLRPIQPSIHLAGRAVTLQTVPVVDRPPDAFMRELEVIDQLQPHDIIVADARSVECAFWGELLSTAAAARGAVGAVIDGWVRDVATMRRMGFPVFSRGASPYDSIGRLDLAATDRPILCGGVAVRPGDILVGDDDGIAVIPAERLNDVLLLAEEKAQGEDRVRHLYASGRSARDVYREHAIL